MYFSAPLREPHQPFLSHSVDRVVAYDCTHSLGSSVPSIRSVAAADRL